MLDIGVSFVKKMAIMENIRCAALMKGYALSGARENFIDLEGGAPKTSIFYDNSVKDDIFTVLKRWFSPRSRGLRGRTPGQVRGAPHPRGAAVDMYG